MATITTRAPCSKVELRPSFKAKPGKYTDLVAFCKKEFVGTMRQAVTEGTLDESKCIHYNFVANPELELCICREAYSDAEGLKTHLVNFKQQVADVQQIADITEVQVTGPTAELDLLTDEIAMLNAIRFDEI